MGKGVTMSHLTLVLSSHDTMTCAWHSFVNPFDFLIICLGQTLPVLSAFPSLSLHRLRSTDRLDVLIVTLYEAVD